MGLLLVQEYLNDLLHFLMKCFAEEEVVPRSNSTRMITVLGNLCLKQLVAMGNRTVRRDSMNSLEFKSQLYPMKINSEGLSLEKFVNLHQILPEQITVRNLLKDLFIEVLAVAN